MAFQPIRWAEWLNDNVIRVIGRKFYVTDRVGLLKLNEMSQDWGECTRYG